MYILFQFTTYICVQDISQDVISRNSSISSQPTYAYKIYHAIPIRCHKIANSQPTYAYKIYLWAEYPNKRRKRSQPTYAYKIYRENRNRFGGIITLTTYICIQDISLHQHRKRERKPLTTYICIQDISQINTNISCLQGLNLQGLYLAESIYYSI